MSQFEKLVERFKRKPTDFTYDELRTLLKGFEYRESNQGKSSGSRVAFVNGKTKHIIRMHKPHPSNILKSYLVEMILEELTNQGVIK